MKQPPKDVRKNKPGYETFRPIFKTLLLPYRRHLHRWSTEVTSTAAAVHQLVSPSGAHVFQRDCRNLCGYIKEQLPQESHDKSLVHVHHIMYIRAFNICRGAPNLSASRVAALLMHWAASEEMETPPSPPPRRPPPGTPHRPPPPSSSPRRPPAPRGPREWI